MNIFKALSNGNGTISETNTSSFLAYLLDPSETHGLNDVFLKKFLELISEDEKTIKDLLNADYKEVNLESPYTFENNPRGAIIDVEIIFSNIKDGEIKSFHKICVENKIKKGAMTPEQLNKYYTAVKDDKDSDEKITMVYLTTNDKCFKTEFEPFCTNDNDGDCKSHIVWHSKDKEGEKSVIGIIQKILCEEQKAQISPISDYLKQTLKAFCYYILNPRKKEIIEVRRGDIIVGGKNYTIIQYKPYRIEVYDNSKKRVSARAITMEYLKEAGYKEKDYPSQKGREVFKCEDNTHSLGRKVLKDLDNKKN